MSKTFRTLYSWAFPKGKTFPDTVSKGHNTKLTWEYFKGRNELPKPRLELNIELHTIDRLLIDDMKKPLIIKEPLIITLGTGTSLGTISSIKPNSNMIKFLMKNPAVVEDDQKISLSRRSTNGWRLYGYGFIRK